jgi:hypothetical protein
VSSRLYYRGTTTEVLVGDRIALRGWFSPKGKPGTVSCIPDRTGRERAAEGKGAENWLINFDDGTMTGWLYSPEDLQPPKHLSFLGRGEPGYKGISNEEADELERRAEAETGWGQLIALALFKLGLLVGVIALLRYMWKTFVSMLPGG